MADVTLAWPWVFIATAQFLLTIFVQTVLGYSALKAGVAFLPFTAMLVVVSGSSASWSPGPAPGR